MNTKITNSFSIFVMICLSAFAYGQTYFSENFEGSSLTSNNEWTVFNVVPSTSNLSWFHDTNQNPGRARVSNYINATQSNEALESWLITSNIDLSGASSPVFTFENTKRFAGDDIQLLISTNYDGSSDPSDAQFSWEDITDEANFDNNVGSWNMVSSDEVDLSDFSGQSIYIAFKYVGSDSDGSTYQIDNILLEEDDEDANPNPGTPECAIGIFCDDFDGNSLTSNNAWTVFNVVESANNFTWTHSINQGNGRARISNYLNTTETNDAMESWLISPAISLEDVSSPILTFENTKRFEGDDIQLLVSTNYDGSSNPTDAEFSWENLTNEANFDSDISSWNMIPSANIDLSDFSDETIYIAFKYVGSDSDGSTYQIDNILLEDNEDPTDPDPVTPECAIGIFCDDFQGNSLTANNPWIIVSTVPSPNNLSWFHNVFSGEGSAQISNYISSSQTNQVLESWLITPSLNLTDYPEVEFSFDHTKRFAGDDLELLISTDYDGSNDPTSATWTNITNLANMDNNVGSWNLISSGQINISSIAGGEATVYIAFKYTGGATSGSTYRIDNVLVREAEPISTVSIYDIQFTTDPSGDSPLDGEVVTTSGIVTAVGDGFYFIQDGVGAWNGIEIFNNTNNPSLGDSVVVTGTVKEYFGFTQIEFITSFQVITSGNNLPEAFVISTGDMSEMYEGVLIQAKEAFCTNNNAGFSMWEINNGTGPLLVDDKMFLFSATQNTQYDVTGIGNFAFGTHRISPRFASDVTETVSVKDAVKSKVSLYPNPVSEKLNVKGLNEGTIEIIDVLGKTHLVFEYQGEGFLPVNELERGAYILKSSQGMFKFIKE